MKVPAWEMWSNEHSWGVRELDTRKLREGASIEEAYSDTVWHIDMGCIPELSHTNDALIVGQWLKNWAWDVGIGLLLDDHFALAEAYDELATEMKAIDEAADRIVVTPIGKPGQA